VSRPPYRARREGTDHDAAGHELRPEPRERPEEKEAQGGLPERHAHVQPHGEQRRPRERGRRGELRVHRGGVRQERRAQTDRNSRGHRPRIGRHAQRQPVRQRDRQCGDGGQKQLDGLRASERERGGDQQREAQTVRLVQPSIGLPPVRPQLVRIELPVRPLGVLVAHVDVAVVDERLRGQQVVRLVAAVIRAAERVQPERRGVDAEQQQPEREGATHRAPHPSRARSTAPYSRTPSAT